MAHPKIPRIISCVYPVDNAKKAIFTLGYKAFPEFKSTKEKPFELRGVYSTGASKFRQATVTFDDEWHEYVWPFTYFREEKAIRFEIRVLPGEGTVYFKKLEVKVEQ